jgi:hypothetical protein
MSMTTDNDKLKLDELINYVLLCHYSGEEIPVWVECQLLLTHFTSISYILMFAK